MLTVYGSMQCPKTVKILGGCRKEGIEIEYRDISDSLKHLWEFVVIRDGEEALAAAKKNRRLGIPCVIFENGAMFDCGEEPFDFAAVMRRIRENI
ncbi:hypothetical protein [Cloacibacillus porcorum]